MPGPPGETFGSSRMGLKSSTAAFAVHELGLAAKSRLLLPQNQDIGNGGGISFLDPPSLHGGPKPRLHQVHQ